MRTVASVVCHSFPKVPPATAAGVRTVSFGFHPVRCRSPWNIGQLIGTSVARRRVGAFSALCLVPGCTSAASGTASKLTNPVKNERRSMGVQPPSTRGCRLTWRDNDVRAVVGWRRRGCERRASSWLVLRSHHSCSPHPPVKGLSSTKNDHCVRRDL